MDIRKLVGMGILAGALGLAGCGDDDGGGDAGGGGGTDGGGTDAGPMDPDLPLAQVGDISGDDPTLIDPATASPADFSCVGSATAPADDGEEISFTLTVEDFQEGTPVADVCVEFYPDNTVPVSDDTCSGETTNESGEVTVMDNAGSWYAYRVFPRTGPTPSTTPTGSVQFNEPAPGADGGSATGNSVSAATLALIPTVLGFSREAGTAIIAGTLTDCNDDPVYGVIIRAYTADGTLIPEGARRSEPHFRYFNGDDFPSANQPWSHVDGLFAAANLPVATQGEEFFLEMWGRTTADGPLELLGCEKGRLFTDTVTILNLTPKRSDGPTCPGEM